MSEMSINLAWTAGSSNAHFGIVAKYKWDCRTSFSAKVNNANLTRLGYTQTLHPGFKLTLRALTDRKNFKAGGHKIGLGYESEA